MKLWYFTQGNSINKFKKLPSTKMVISKTNPNKRFSLCQVSNEGSLKQIKNVDTRKAIQQNTIPTKLLKQESYFSNFFHQNVNISIKNSKFPSDLELVDVTPCHKNKSKTSKGNYRPISILPNISKLY